MTYATNQWDPFGMCLTHGRLTIDIAPPERNMELLSLHHRVTCSMRDWELASKLTSPL